MDRLIFVIDLILWRCNESDPYNPSAFIDSISPIIYGIRLEFWQCYGIKDPYQNLHQAMHHAASLEKSETSSSFHVIFCSLWNVKYCKAQSKLDFVHT